MEMAAAVAQGYTVEQIKSELDISAFEFEEALATDEFTKHLATYGSNVVDLWEEHRATNRSGSVQRKISERLDDYYEELHTLAMGGKGGSQLKPEKRADVLLAFLNRAAPEDREDRVVRMPPAVLDNIAKRQIEFEKYIETPTEEGQAPNTDGGQLSTGS